MELEALACTLRGCSSTENRFITLKSFLGNRQPTLSYSEHTPSALVEIIDTVAFPKDEHGDARADDAAFVSACKYARMVCNFLHGLLMKMDEDLAKEKENFFTKLVPHCIKLYASFQRHINTWCDKETELCANQVLEEILKIGGFSNVRQALDASEQLIFEKLLDHILPFLTKEKWKESCAVKSTFVCIVTNTGGDVLTENLDKILPFTLVLVDDFVSRNAVLGIRCMNHIMSEVPPAELRLRGRADVLHDSISRKLYTTDPRLAESLVPCVLQSLRCLEPEMMRKRGCRIPKHDKCFDTVLNNIHLSSNTSVKRAFARSLPIFISSMGIQSIGHMKTLRMVLEHGFETSDLLTVKHFACTVVELVNQAWPRLTHHCEKLLEILVKTLYSIANDEWRTHNATKKDVVETMDSLTEAIVQLAHVSKSVVEETVSMLAKEECLGLQEHAVKVQREIASLVFAIPKETESLR